MKQKLILHYIYDPFCGWCYGLAPVIDVAVALNGVEVVAHGGGMLTGENAQMMSPEWREFVRPHEHRISAISGQVFGEAYSDGAQFDYSILLDSSLPTAAMLAAEEVAGAGLRMLKALQIAYYVKGRPIAMREEIPRVAAELGLDASAFAEALDRAVARLDKHFSESLILLAQLDSAGFPTLALEKDGVMRKLHVGQFLGKPDAFRAMLTKELESPTA
ncbi:protein-disulfide isomerase [Paraburkholderia phytofirmans OLGA172]|uniref:Protein-disulfide isomerase n=1 Tax=Paraburkholderia phytofirmans OLGA172 TaxID=1417228 RepID=A0A160FUN0_9BURK|nr:DsbA family protein [Paraburkholderia phytofirmans]ANB76488.1 protein-disulfide isomerase [Paraburkholderia phytofirmans OLGA172]